MTVSRRLLAAWAFAVLLIGQAVGVTTQAQASLGEDAQAFIANVSEKAVALAGESSLDMAERERRFRALLRESFDYDRIASFTLGPYRRRATDAQVESLAALLEDNVVLTYLQRFAEYSGQTVRIAGVREGRNGSAEVTTEIFTPGSSADPLVARWIVQEGSNGLRIVDVTLEAIRMTVTYRDDFVDVITQANGDIDVLLNELKTRNDRLAGQR